VSYIEEFGTSSAELPTFKLADLANMYKSCLQRLGCDTTSLENTSCLKERLVFQIPGLQCYNKGYDVYLAFRDDVGFALHKAHEQDCDEDQAHEQNNAMVKGEGGAVGLTENPNALRRWMLSGPEMLRLVNEFEAGMVPDTGTKENSKKKEEHRSFQVTFFKDVKSLAAAVEDLGNPFLEETGDLFTLDTKVIAEESAVSRMRHIESLGKEQCETFISARLIEKKKPLSDPITRNKLSFFTVSSNKSSKATQQLSSMKRDCSLFSRMYISCRNRDGDLDEFFRHENQGCPPPLSDQGN